MKKLFKICTLIVLLTPFAFALPSTAPTKFSWTAPAEYADGSTIGAGDIVGYRLYWVDSIATEPTNRNSVDTGNVTTFLFSDLPVDPHRKYFVITAVLANGVEGGFSERVYVVPFNPPVAPAGFRVE